MLGAASDLWTVVNNQWSNLEAAGKNGLKAIGVVMLVVCIAKGGTIVKFLGLTLTIGLALYVVYNLTAVRTTVEQTVDPNATSMGPLTEAPSTGPAPPAPAWLLGTTA
jgi:hypothetical protein